MNNGYIGINRSDAKVGVNSLDNTYDRRVWRDRLTIGSADDLPDLVAWYQPTGILETGGTVTGWTDSKGNFTMGAYGSNDTEPTFHSSKVNGYDAVKFENTTTDVSALISTSRTDNFDSTTSDWLDDKVGATLFTVSAFEKTAGDSDTTPGNVYGSSLCIAHWNQGMNQGDLGHYLTTTNHYGYFSFYGAVNAGYWYTTRDMATLRWVVTVQSIKLEDGAGHAPNSPYNADRAVAAHAYGKDSREAIRENGIESATRGYIYLRNSLRMRGGKLREGGGVASPSNIDYHHQVKDTHMYSGTSYSVACADSPLVMGYGMHVGYRSPGYAAESGLYRGPLSMGECQALMLHLSTKYNITLDA